VRRKASDAQRIRSLALAISASSSFVANTHAYNLFARARARDPHLEDALRGEDDALGLVDLAVLRLGVELGEEGRVLRRHGLELVAERADDRLELGLLRREGLFGREGLGRVGNGAEAELDDLGRWEGLLACLLEELLRVNARNSVEWLLRAPTRRRQGDQRRRVLKGRQKGRVWGVGRQSKEMGMGFAVP
jgi:hypothetical protein